MQRLESFSRRVLEKRSGGAGLRDRLFWKTLAGILRFSTPPNTRTKKTRRGTRAGKRRRLHGSERSPIGAGWETPTIAGRHLRRRQPSTERRNRERDFRHQKVSIRTRVVGRSHHNHAPWRTTRPAKLGLNLGITGPHYTSARLLRRGEWRGIIQGARMPAACTNADVGSLADSESIPTFGIFPASFQQPNAGHPPPPTGGSHCRSRPFGQKTSTAIVVAAEGGCL